MSNANLDTIAREFARDLAQWLWDDTGVMTATAQRHIREQFKAAASRATTPTPDATITMKTSPAVLRRHADLMAAKDDPDTATALRWAASDIEALSAPDITSTVEHDAALKAASNVCRNLAFQDGAIDTHLLNASITLDNIIVERTKARALAPRSDAQTEGK